jgi:hypothetical protein
MHPLAKVSRFDMMLLIFEPSVHIIDIVSNQYRLYRRDDRDNKGVNLNPSWR